MRRLHGWLGVFGLIALPAACTVAPAPGGEGSGGATACVPGTQLACAVPNACTGIQVCAADGHGYGPCECGGVGGAGGAAAGGAGGTGGGVANPTFVNIEVISILAGPGKVDGTQWDDTDKVPQEVWDGLAAALGFPGAGKVLDFMESAAAQSLNKPDPYGMAELDWAGTGFDPKFNMALGTVDNNTEDTFLPIWPQISGYGMPGWHKVYFTMDLKVRITLWDEDLVNDDDMGILTLDGSAIGAAWEAGGTYWVRVENQTQKQVLAVALQVTTSG